MKTILQSLIVSTIIFSTSLSLGAQRSTPIFVFHTDDFWLNLHHFLYVLGRAENKERDTAREAVSGAPADQDSGLQKLTESERKIWREAVTFYANGLSKKDVVFDRSMPVIANALVLARDSESLTGTEVDPEIASTLKRTAPLYRKAWWQKHREANRSWHKSIQQLVERHGTDLLAYITKAYKLDWPTAGFPIHVSAYSNWAGAYSTSGNLLVVASHSTGVQGLYGLETVFHEAMHQWDRQIFEALRQEAIKLNKVIPRGLSHSIIFYTAGEAVRSVAREHVPYAEKFGVWQRGMEQFKAPLEAAWKPYLDGNGTRDEALAALVRLVATDPPKNPGDSNQ
ncbi:MAG TPA: hypothetical protein VIT88_00800 [Pyrinomonadaceae bacterium]